MDVEPLQPRQETPRDGDGEKEPAASPAIAPKRKAKKPKKDAAILDKTTTLKDQDFAGARAAYSASIKKQNEEIAEKALEKVETDRAREAIFGVPDFFSEFFFRWKI